jgi:hypothetical protein
LRPHVRIAAGVTEICCLGSPGMARYYQGGIWSVNYEAPAQN